MWTDFFAFLLISSNNILVSPPPLPLSWVPSLGSLERFVFYDGRRAEVDVDIICPSGGTCVISLLTIGIPRDRLCELPTATEAGDFVEFSDGCTSDPAILSEAFGPFLNEIGNFSSQVHNFTDDNPPPGFCPDDKFYYYISVQAGLTQSSRIPRWRDGNVIRPYHTSCQNVSFSWTDRFMNCHPSNPNPCPNILSSAGILNSQRVVRYSWVFDKSL
jgi:hypothetical protein